MSETLSSNPPLMDASVVAGFPSPSEQYSDTPLDLNTLMVKRPSGTYFVRVSGDSMQNAGILDGDCLVVDKTLSPNENDIVIAAINNEFTVKFFHRSDKHIILSPANPRYRDIHVREGETFEIFGVVTGVIRQLIKS